MILAICSLGVAISLSALGISHRLERIAEALEALKEKNNG